MVCSTNLHLMLKANLFRGYDQKVIRKIGESMLQCLQFLCRENIMHGDLKPVR